MEDKSDLERNTSECGVSVIADVFGGDTTGRQLRETVLIQQTPTDTLLNSRDEWQQEILPRIGLSLS